MKTALIATTLAALLAASITPAIAQGNPPPSLGLNTSQSYYRKWINWVFNAPDKPDDTERVCAIALPDSVEVLMIGMAKARNYRCTSAMTDVNNVKCFETELDRDWIRLSPSRRLLLNEYQIADNTFLRVSYTSGETLESTKAELFTKDASGKPETRMKYPAVCSTEALK